jgi:hypothetical protein
MGSFLRLSSAAQLSAGAVLLVALASAAGGPSGCANGTTDVPVDAGTRMTTTRDASASADDSNDDAGEDVGDDSSVDGGSSTVLVDSGGPDASTTSDAGSGSADSGSADGGGTTTDSGGATTDSGTCTSTPTIPSEAKGNYCFGAGSDGCLGTDTVCCDEESSSGKYTASCVSSSSSCTAPSGGTAYAYSCGTPADCSLDAYCVLSAATSNSAISVDSCGNVSGVKGSICATNPSTSDSFVCASNDDCLITVGGTCTAVSVNNKFFGICQ